MRVNFREFNNKISSQIPYLVERLLPNGKADGHEYTALNPKRNDNNLGSFRVNLHSGKWADFATGDSGGDIISLYAYVHDINQYQALLLIDKLRG